jgi:hypothetical protein
MVPVLEVVHDAPCLLELPHERQGFVLRAAGQDPTAHWLRWDSLGVAELQHLQARASGRLRHRQREQTPRLAHLVGLTDAADLAKEEGQRQADEVPCEVGIFAFWDP